MSCPHCAQEIAPGTVVCPHCRTVVHPESVPAAARVEEPQHTDPLGAGGYFFLGFAGVILSGLVLGNAETDGGVLVGWLIGVFSAAGMLIGVVAKGVEVGNRASRD